LEIIGQITGKYQIIERVGQDGTSAIYKATNLTDDSTVALKVLSSTKASDPTFKARVSREIEVLQTLDHPHILPILDYGEFGEQAYIVMPFYQHGTLQDHIDQGLTPEQGAKIISQVSEALEYSHAQGITHRNLKPSNILIDENGNAVLSDFGFEHKSGSSLSPTAETRIGTPAYMSPEQCRGEETDSRSDQYSLAVVIYQMTTGRLPFDAAYPMALVIKHLNDPVPSPRDINPNVPKKVEAILLKGLSKDPSRRYASVAALNQALQASIAHQEARPSARASRRTRQSSTAPAGSPRLKKGARVALVLSIMLAVPGAVYGLATFGAGFGSAGGGPRVLYSSQDPTEFTAAGYAAQTEIAPPEVTLISPEIVPTEVEATQTEITDSQTGEGEDVTPYRYRDDG
jgi:serine/threonine-protein kinase